ncbi:DNA-directed RNA polymerase subunit alpha [bacterium]|nr:DNA-directed RNA polymerase subunit alpha [bacterium]|tara:strand:+ start:8788 stop:9768 length:981 start_codon:yes stop_codon:yes gene_type:complete
MYKISIPNKPIFIKGKNNTGIFEVKPCYPGYGLTLGNAIRRVLLSSIPGTAITSVKISGVKHEFSTIPHVLEDVVNIILNLKQLCFVMHTDAPQTLTISVKGEKTVKASDIKTSPDVEIVDKKAHIATLTDKSAVFEMEMTLEKGLGYYPAEQRVDEQREIGTIVIDAFFSPIKKVNYNIENIRMGERTDFNKLILEIETDGSITAKESFEQAVKILLKHVRILDLSRPVKKPKKVVKKQVKKISTKKPKKVVKKQVKIRAKDFLIQDLKISGRSINVLHDNRIKTIASLLKKSDDKLKELPGLGSKGVQEIKREVGKLGFLLKTE